MLPDRSSVSRSCNSPRNSLAGLHLAVGVAAASILLSGCTDTPTPVDPGLPPNRSVSGRAAGEVVTSNPEQFAQALRTVGNENEVIILLKDPDVPAVAPDFLREMDTGAPLVVGVRNVPDGTPRRRTPGLARAGAAAQTALLQVLGNQGIEPYRYDPQMLALRIPDEKLVPVLALLLNHPSVDYVEANQKRPIIFTAAPWGRTLPTPSTPSTTFWVRGTTPAVRACG